MKIIDEEIEKLEEVMLEMNPFDGGFTLKYGALWARRFAYVEMKTTFSEIQNP